LVIPNAHMPVDPHRPVGPGMSIDSRVGPGPGRGGMGPRKNQPKGFFEGVWDDVVNFF
jgi:hypothetical protein